MLNLRSFIESVQEAVLGANDALIEKNMDLVNRFFEADPDMEDLQNKLDAAVQAAGDLNQEGDKASSDQLNKATEAFKALQQVLNVENSAQDVLSEKDLRPKTVSMTYPIKDDDGNIVSKEVLVPLITLVPITLSQVEQFTLRANIMMHDVDGEVQVQLGGKAPAGAASAPAAGTSKTNDSTTSVTVQHSGNNVGSVEIVIKPQPVADGMQQVIDAYEKVLKSQL